MSATNPSVRPDAIDLYRELCVNNIASNECVAFVMDKISFTAAFICFGITLFYIKKTMENMNPNKKILPHILGPALFIWPNIFTKTGVIYRKKLILSIFCTAVIFYLHFSVLRKF